MIITISRPVLAMLMVCSCIFLSAQLPITWSQNLGDSNKNIIQDVIDLDGQGCLTIGYTKDEATRNVDVWISRVDRNGTRLWSTNLGSTCFESAHAAAILDDGNIVIVGQGSFANNTNSDSRTRDDGAVLKIDTDGKLIWQRTFGGLGQDQFTDVVALPNGQCVAVGSSTSYTGVPDGRATDGWAVRINTNGAAIWNQTFGGGLMDRYTSLLLDSNGDLLMGGASNSKDGDIKNANGLDDLWVSKISINGEHLWSRKFGGASNDILNGMSSTIDGGYVLAGTSFSSLPGHQGHGDVYVMKISAQGTPIWEHNYGGSSNDKSTDIIAFEGDGFLLASTTFSDDGDIEAIYAEQDAWLTKLDANGEIVWQQTLGGSKNDALNALAISDNGSIWLAGYSFSLDQDLSANFGLQDGWLIGANVSSTPIVDLGADMEVCMGTEIILDASDPNCQTCTYLWSDNVTVPMRTILVSGSSNFSVTLTNSVGEMSSDQINITAVNPISATASIVDVSCHDAADGEIILATIGGTGTYTYQWSNIQANTPANTRLLPGTYFVTISDDAFCEYTNSFTIDAPPALMADANLIEPSCNSTGQGQISLNVMGGEAPYDIQWSNGATGPDIFNLSSGQYMATITDNRNCVLIETYFLSNNIGIAIAENIDHVSCFEFSDGEIALNVSGDFPPFSFMWNNGFSSRTIVGLSPGDYTVTITDAMDCQLIKQYSITEPNTIEVFEEQTNVQEGKSDGRILLNIIGGTPSYFVQWSNGGTGILQEDLAPGIYTATITDTNGCELIASFEIMISTATNQIVRQTLDVYPNPNTGTFTVNIPEQLQGNISVALTSIDGKKVDLGIHNQTTTQLTVITQLGIPGLYILTLQDDQYIYQSKLIIQP